MIALTDLDRIRCLSIIAHIDHGKSTLADRILELTGAVDTREMREQLLDTWTSSASAGITIKAQTVRLEYGHDGMTYVLNLIDTPGHVDFNYEVSRALAACEGAILLVDATQGVEAQTLANCYLAIEHGLEIVAVAQQDRPAGRRPREAREEIEDVLGIPADEVLQSRRRPGGRRRAARAGRRAHSRAEAAMPTRRCAR